MIDNRHKKRWNRFYVACVSMDNISRVLNNVQIGVLLVLLRIKLNYVQIGIMTYTYIDFNDLKWLKYHTWSAVIGRVISDLSKNGDAKLDHLSPVAFHLLIE